MTEDVASTLNLTRQHVYVLAACGQLPSIKFSGGRGSVRFGPKDVEALIEAHRRGAVLPKNAV